MLLEKGLIVIDLDTKFLSFGCSFYTFVVVIIDLSMKTFFFKHTAAFLSVANFSSSSLTVMTEMHQNFLLGSFELH